MVNPPEPTDAMVRAALEAFLGAPMGNIAEIDSGMRDALSAAFGLLARDYDIRPRHTEVRDGYLVEQLPSGKVTTHYFGPATAAVVADAAHQDTRSTGVQLRDAQDACPDCTSPIYAHRYVLPLMRDGVYVGNQPCSDPWHDRPLTITKTSPPADHPHTDPGDGRTECETCGKFVWLVTHSCKLVPVTPAARARWDAKYPPTDG